MLSLIRAETNKFRVKMYYMCLSVILSNLTATYVVASGQDWRCVVELVFSSDDNGTVANYVMNLQLKNTLGRNINGVSVIYKNQSMDVIGNAHLICKIGAQPIKPGSFGECSKVVQQVDSSFMEAFGTEKWTEIVNTQLKKLTSVQYCEVLGYSY